MPVKRFMLFGGDQYDYGGGVGAYIRSADTAEEAAAFQETDSCREWWHVFDRLEGKVVLRNERRVGPNIPEELE